jgi:hypothetical protein
MQRELLPYGHPDPIDLSSSFLASFHCPPSTTFTHADVPTLITYIRLFYLHKYKWSIFPFYEKYTSYLASLASGQLVCICTGYATAK